MAAPGYKSSKIIIIETYGGNDMKKYDPEVGDPDNGIAAGTAFEDLPEDWVCPLCGLGKEVFGEVE